MTVSTNTYINMMYSSSALLEKVNAGIAGLKYSHEPRGLYEPITYVLSLGGKRIRPVLMLLAYNMYKEETKAALMPAIGIEMYHNYTLLHDDLMDRADMRRNKPTVHKVWNDNVAILSGDTMLVLAYQLMSRCSKVHLKEVLDLFSLTAQEIGEGQQYDMEFESRNDVTEAEYIEMIRLKTSVLLAASLKIGSILADAPSTDSDILYDFGVQIGLAFQLQDDYLDVYGDTATFGKKIGGDILCNKKTFLLINALRNADDKQRAELQMWLDKKDFLPEEKIAAVTRIYNETGVRELCSGKIDSIFAAGMAQLDRLSVPKDRRETLRQFALSLMNRKV